MKSIIALAVMLFATAAHGQLLKCVAKDGRVEYATQCPAGTKEQSTGIRSTPASPAAPAGTAAPKQQSLAERDAEFRKRQMESGEAQAKDEKKKAEDEQRQRVCDNARVYLKSLEGGHRIAQVDPKTGERVFLEDAQYASEIAAARKSVETNCK